MRVSFTIFVVLVALSLQSGFVTVHPRKFLKFLSYFSQERDASGMGPSRNDAPELLKTHTKLFSKKEILTVVPGVHVAIGFGLANVILVDDGGEDGLVLIDAMESEEAMTDVLSTTTGFGKIIKSRKINTLIYTHFHQDHTMGAEVVNASRVVAHDLTRKLLTHSPVTGPITYKRAMRQFGVFVPEDSFINSGIGPHLRLLQRVGSETRSLTSRVGNTELLLHHCPGETPDQIVIYMPSKRILFASDNIYQSFPNMYAIRGTPSREAMLWVESLDLMRSLKAEVLVPSHTRPVYGQKEIYDLLTVYRDAIQFVHDQTVYHMNRGLTPNEIVKRVTLPPSIRNHPWLAPFYGTVEWGSRAVFSHYLGWFSGDARDLHPIDRSSFASALLTVSSVRQILDFAQRSLSESVALENDKKESAQLALEFSSIVLDANKAKDRLTNEDVAEAQAIRLRSLHQLSSLSMPATGRNYFTTFSLELQGKLSLQIPQSVAANNLKQIDSGENLLKTLRVNLDAEAASGLKWLCFFRFTDTNEYLSFAIRNSIVDIAHVGENDAAPDLLIETTRQAWSDVMAKVRSPVVLLAKGEIKLPVGNVVQLTKFRTLFSSPLDVEEDNIE